MAKTGPRNEDQFYVGSGSSATIIARSLSGGANNAVTFSTYAGNLASGSDGNIWFSLGTTKIVKMTPAGVVTMYIIPGMSVSYEVGGPVLGPGGAIWFAYRDSAGKYVGRLGY